MTTVTLTSTAPARVAVEALVLGIAKRKDGRLVLAPGATDVDQALHRRLAATLTTLGATGAPGEVTRFPSHGATKAATLVAVGLGDAPSSGGRYPAETLRRAAGAAARTLAGARSLATTLALSNGDAGPEEVRAVAEGIQLGAYAFTRYRSLDGVAKPPVPNATILVDAATAKAAKAAKAQIARAGVIAGAVARCRDLVNTAPGDLHPKELAEAAVEICTPLDLAVEVLDEKALKKGGFGGILGVGSGSTHPPRLVRIGYTHPAATTTVALIGKGITFDSGGLSLKPNEGMLWMKADMGGAAAVIATIAAVAELELPVNVTTWVPTAENMPSGTAIRPSDVLTIRGGKTVEVLNTDAEGRLILADGIVRASEESPDVIIDVATLTGAQLVALGSLTFAVMANDDALRAELVQAAGRAGELAWPMPLPEELRKSLDSEIADIANLGDRNGGMLVAGLFLRDFVPDGVRWAHLDIAGPAWNSGSPWGYTPKGGTGVPVRTLVEYIASLC